MRAAVLALAFTSTVVFAQAPPPDGPRFEVVSIKRNMSNALGSNGSSYRPDGGFTRINVPMMTLVGQAHSIAPIDMIGLPEWSRTDMYDVSATSPLGRPATTLERASMIRAMLADRVKLVAHMETRELPAWDLVLARSDGRLGPGMRPSEVDCVAKAAAEAAAAAAGTPPPPRVTPRPDAPPPPCSPLFVTTRVEGDTTMENLARFLRTSAGRPIVDKTGLKGSYRIRVQFDRVFVQSGPDLAPTANALPTVFAALPDQLGLKLESSRAVRDVLVIDRLERPTEN